MGQGFHIKNQLLNLRGKRNEESNERDEEKDRQASEKRHERV